MMEGLDKIFSAENLEKEMKKAQLIQYAKYVGVAVLVGTAGYMACKGLQHIKGIDESLKKIAEMKGAQTVAPIDDVVSL